VGRNLGSGVARTIGVAVGVSVGGVGVGDGVNVRVGLGLGGGVGYSESFREQAGGQVRTPKFLACSQPDVGVEHHVSFS